MKNSGQCGLREKTEGKLGMAKRKERGNLKWLEQDSKP